MIDGLFQSDDTSYQGDGVEGGDRELEGGVSGVVGDQKNVLLVGSLPYSLDECALVGIEYIGFVPLEEDVGEGDFLARHEVA